MELTARRSRRTLACEVVAVLVAALVLAAACGSPARQSARAPAEPTAPGRSAPGAIGKGADQHTAERPEDVADAEGAERKQQTGEGCRCRKERLADIDGKKSIGRKIVEFQRIAQDSRDDDLFGDGCFQGRLASAAQSTAGAVLFA